MHTKDGVGYYVMAVSYECKMFIKLTTAQRTAGKMGQHEEVKRHCHPTGTQDNSKTFLRSSYDLKSFGLFRSTEISPNNIVSEIIPSLILLNLFEN